MSLVWQRISNHVTLPAVYEPTDVARPCDHLKCLNSNNNIPPGTDDNEITRSEVFWKGEVGVTLPLNRPKDYWILVGGHEGEVGEYQLTITVRHEFV